MTRAALGLGSNLGSREALLRAARDLWTETEGVELLGVSRVYETPPLGPPQPDYLNAALLVRAVLGPEALLARAREIEAVLGRERRERWGARTLDVDLLWIEGIEHRSETLSVPHPELCARAFALAPLVELAPDARDPREGFAYAARLAELPPASASVPRELGAGFPTEELEHTADEGFVVRARDRADLLAAAGEALAGLVVIPASVRAAGAIAIAVDAPEGGWLSDDERLFAWLSEVLYHVDARRFAVRRAVVLDDGEARVRGVLVGEPLDEARHEVRGAIKAVTYHAMEVGPDEGGGLRAQVVVDV